jgi:hypothetical protein
MFDCQLFLGLPLDSELSQLLSSLPQPIRDSFIQKEESTLYLQQIEHEGKLYVGKALGVLFDTEALSSMKEHLLSVLHRLLPEVSCQSRPLVLLAIPSDLSH